MPLKNNSKAKIKLLLVDDHTLLRNGLEAILSTVDDFEIVGSVSSGEETINITSSLKPHVILMDVVMRGMSGIEATRWIKEQNPLIKVILISSEVKKELVEAGIQSGIDGYLPKDVHQSTLIDAIRTVMQGGRFFSEAITSLVFEDFYTRKRVKTLTGKTTNATDLSKREQEVLQLLAAGKGTKVIADELFISVKTVETHRANILDKVGLKNNVELVRYAIKNNLISLD